MELPSALEYVIAKSAFNKNLSISPTTVSQEDIMKPRKYNVR